MSTLASEPVPARPRIVVADDSRLMRGVICRALQDAGLDVVGAAADGDEALSMCSALRPDAMTLDLAMPGTDGMAVLRRLREPGAPDVPVVVVSAFSPSSGARAVDALAEGAFELAVKPTIGDSLERFSAELVDKLRVAAASGGHGRPVRTSAAPTASATTTSARAVAPAPAGPAVSAPAGLPTSGSRPRPRTPVAGQPTQRTRPATGSARGERVVLIACSTGGPRALAELIPALPTPLGAGTIIVQHMPAGFTGSLAARLDRASALTVREANADMVLDPTVALLAPGGSHLRLADGGATVLSDDAAIGGLRPRADLTIADAAALFGRRLLLVVLTGMGRDGLEGAREVRRRGGRVLVEAERTCTVYGMPRAIAEAGLADGVFDLPDLAAAVTAEVRA